jgi:diguanylate cyclase (GGDEF)-like protein/PAS domain S-box-containing protein
VPFREPQSVRPLLPALVGGLVLAHAAAGVVPMSLALVVVGLVAAGYAALVADLPWTAGAPPAAVRYVAVGLAFGALSSVLAGTAYGIAPGAHLSDVPLPAELPLIGLFFVAGMFMLGLFHLPGLTATYFGRLRRALDGVGIGLCAFFIAWLLVFDGAGFKGAALTAVLVACIAISASAVGAVRAMPVHPAAVACGLGVLISIGAHTGLVLALDYHRSTGWLAGVGGALLVGSALTYHAVRSTRSHEVPAPPKDASGDGSFARYPLLALPMAGALVAAAYHLVVFHRFDSVSTVVAISGVVVVALREALAVADVRQYARRLAEREDRFRSLVVGSTDVTMMLDDALVVRWQSPAAARQLGLSDQDVIGRPLLGRVHPDDVDLVAGGLTGAGRGNPVLIEARLRDGFGAWRDTEWSVSDQRSVASVHALVVHIRDISQRKELEHSLHRAALTDQLTGLANRGELRRALTARTTPGVLIMFALDGLAGVNQVRGHEVGDAVLVEAGRRLRVTVGPDDLAARVASDQLAVLITAGAVQAQLTAGRLLTVLAEPYPVLGVASHLSVLAGLAECPPEPDADTALSRAEMALQRARRLGPTHPPQWYDEATAALLRRRLSLEQDLPGALQRGEFDLLYQPVLELPGRRVVGVEAFPRWRRPGLGTVPASEFLPVVEQLGLHEQIGRWQLNAACRQLAQWLEGGRQLWLAVGVPVAQLAAPGFVDAFASTLNVHAVAPGRLVLQFGEAGAATPSRLLTEQLTQLRTLGARTALDQFGSQATSLSRLRQLPLDLIKLDAAGAADAHDAVLAAVVNLAQQLGVEVSVQGVRNESELRAAINAGCRLGQGDLFCPPAVPERLEAYLDFVATPPGP